MIPNFPSSQNLNPIPQAFTHAPYINITFSDIRYRLRTRQYFNISASLKIWVMIWSLMTIIDIGIIIDKQSVQNSTILLGFMILAFFILTSHAKRNSNMIGNGLWVSLASVTIFLFFSEIFVILKVNYLLVLTLLLGIEQFLNYLRWWSHRSLTVVKFLIYLQVLLISLKKDHPKVISWQEALFVFLLVWFMSIILLLAVAMFFAITKCYFGQNQHYPQQNSKKYGMGYIGMNCLCVLALCSIPLTATKGFHDFLPGRTKMGIVSIIINLLNCVYEVKFHNRIILFFCNLQEVKGYNQIINLRRISERQSKFIYKFIRKEGDYWYQPQYGLSGREKGQKQTNIQLQCQKNNQQSSQKQQCLICLQTYPTMIWLPCGHLTVCEACTSKLINTQNINCILCKRTPTEIYQVRNEDSCSELQTVSGYRVQVV